MRISEITQDKITDEIVDRVLFEGIQDKGENADCIVVLGSSKAVQYRVQAAVNAFIEGRLSKILMCGGSRLNSNGEIMTEAETMCNRALDLGVPADAIICEKNSENTIENFLFAMVKLQRAILETANIIRCVKNGVFPDFEI